MYCFIYLLVPNCFHVLCMCLCVFLSFYVMSESIIFYAVNINLCSPLIEQNKLYGKLYSIIGLKVKNKPCQVHKYATRVSHNISNINMKSFMNAFCVLWMII